MDTTVTGSSRVAGLVKKAGYAVITGGGPGNATRVLSMLIYDTGFSYLKMGRAAAISVVLFAIMMVFTVLQMRLFMRNERMLA